MKKFEDDFYKFLKKIKNNENFSLSRFGDGELSIIEKNNINLLSKGIGEFSYNNSDKKFSKSRELLKESFQYKENNYYVGIACRCCVGDEKFKYMFKLSKQNEKNLTWANIFVNSNYSKFRNEFIPALENRKTILICHRKSNTNNLPFKTESIFNVESNAWVKNLILIENLIKKINDEKIINHVFLISAGPFANILVYMLHKNNKKNTYIDIGSVFDKDLNLPVTRGYLNGASTLKKVCIW